MQPYMLFLFSILVVMGVSYVGIGLWVLMQKRPLIISSRWYLTIILFAYVPLVASYWIIPGRLEYSTLLMPLMYLVLIVFFWFMLKGYVAIGITDDSFDDALKSALKELNLPFEQALTKIKLASKGMELQVSVQSWMGTGQIKTKRRGKAANALLKDVVASMNHYYKTTHTKTNNVTAIFYLVAGLILAGIAVWFLTTLGSIWEYLG